MQFLRINDHRNATATALADKGELVGEGNPDVEPVDVAAVAARAAMRRTESRGEVRSRGITPGQPRSDPQERTCSFCGKAGNMINDCKRMQKAKVLERRDRAPRKTSPNISGRGPQGNVKAPNLHHPTRRGRKPRAGREAPILAKGRRVGEAQAPAHTHTVPALTSSLCANTLKECKRTSRMEVDQDRGPCEFPGKVPKKADFLWTGLPYGP